MAKGFRFKFFAILSLMFLGIGLAGCETDNGQNDDTGNGGDDVEEVSISLTSDLEGVDFNVSPDHTVSEGEEITIEVETFDGYNFVGWKNSLTGDILSEEQVYVFEINESKTLEAVFEKITEEGVYDSFDGNLDHLRPVFDNMLESEFIKSEMNLNLIQILGESTEEFNFHIEQTLAENPNVIENHFEFSFPNEMNLEGRLILEDDEGDLTAHFKSDVLSSFLMISDEYKDLFDISEEWWSVHTNEQELISALYYLQTLDNDIDVSEIWAILNDFEENDPFLIFELISDVDSLEYTIEQDGDLITTNIHMDGESMKELVDVMLNHIVSEFETYSGDIDFEMIKESPEYEEFMEVLDTMGEVVVPIVYNESDKSISMDMDLKEILEEIDETIDYFETLKMDVKIETEGERTNVDGKNDMNRILSEVIQIQLIEETVHFLEDFHDGYDFDGTYTLKELEDYDVLFFSPMIDKEKSEVTFDGDNGDIYVDFYYLNNSKAVFTESLSLESLPEYEKLLDDSTLDRYLLLEYLGFLDQDNFDLLNALLDILYFEATYEEPSVYDRFEHVEKSGDLEYYDLTGEIYLVYFYLPQCPACQDLFDDIEDFYHDYSDEYPMVFAEATQVSTDIYPITAVPAILVMKDGEMLEGPIYGIEEVLDLLEELMDGDYTP